jgi:ADP-ribose pyrophosphatase YjhB (NUDIX family)
MPRFCSACGAPVGVRAPTACPACGSPHWLNASPAAAALVVHDGKLLLTRRAIEPWRGLWCAPPGFCDGPEHPAACAEREAFEEARVRARVVGYLGHWIDEYASGAPDGTDPQHSAVSYYHAVPTEEPRGHVDGSEVAEVSWFGADELPEELAPPGNGSRIYRAWRAAFASGRLETPLPDLLTAEQHETSS